MFDELKSLFKHSVIYSIGNIMSRAIGFLMIPVYTRYLTPADYGTVEILTLTSTILSLILAMGLSSSVMRFYFDCNKEHEKKEVVSTALIFSLSVALTAVIVLLAFSSELSLLMFNSPGFSLYFKLIILSMFFEISLGVPQIYLRILDKSVMFTVVSIIQLIIGLSLNIYFIVLLKMGVLGVLYSMLFSGLVISVLMITYTFKNVHFHFSLEKLRPMLAYSLPLIPAGLSMFALNSGDRFLLKYFCDLQEVGIYSLGYKFAMVLGMLIGQPFYQVWSPHMFSIAKTKDAPRTYSRIFTYFVFVLVFAGLGLSVLIKDILKIMVTPKFFEAYKVVPIVVIGYIFYQVYYLLPIGIHLEKKTKWLAAIVTFAASVNVVLNWFLIPRYGMMGAAWVTAVSFLCLPVTTYFISRRYYFIHYEFKRIALILFSAVTLYLFANSIDTRNVFLSIALKTGLVLLFPVVLYVVRFYHAEEIRKISELFLRSFQMIAHNIPGLRRK